MKTDYYPQKTIRRKYFSTILLKL